MNPTPEDFDALRRLLALKRHEQPPPGYFTRFSDKVIARIEAEGLLPQPSWWRRILGTVEIRPLAVLSYGAVVLGLFAVGASVSWYLEPDQTAPFAITSPWVAVSAFPATEDSSLAGVRPALDPMNASSSVNPVLATSPAHALFDANRLGVQRINYTF
jgi:hypothetical protein